MLRLEHKVVRLSQIREHCQILRSLGNHIVATSGCFDLLHPGHVLFLHQARSLYGTHLIVCLNSDKSVTRLKGKDRPLFDVKDRALMLAALEAVDTIVVFDDDTPEGVLEGIQPNVYVKGPDYRAEDLLEAAVVREYGGEVHTVPYLSEHRTTALLERPQALPGAKRRKRR
jgi:D-beta-D-heptose 7-phosphate kinase/D-beta-D-heptose 1-phosphate adenosyltransferase